MNSEPAIGWGAARDELGDGATELRQLVELQNTIAKVLPSVTPSVVSIEGGSGVIVSADGFILSASHITQRAGRIVNVTLSDGRIVTATTLGKNANSDTGALQLNSPGPWPYLTMADSVDLKRGHWCLALGYPLSFPRGQPAAVRLGRVLKIDSEKIVADCTIMGGDSGGALIDLNGNLIGINSRVKTEVADNRFVPVNTFHNQWQQLAASIDVEKTQTTHLAQDPTQEQNKGHAYLGILGVKDQDRVRIRSVHEGSPAETAGLKADDVLLQLEGHPIGTFDDLVQVLHSRQPGERIEAKLNRFGTLMSLPIKLGVQ